MRFKSLIACLSTLSLLAACGGQPTEAPAAPPVAVEEPTMAPPPTEAPTEAAAVTVSESTVVLPAVDAATVTGDILTAGSSTVYPLTEALAELFANEGYAGKITIDNVGTGAGFERFCVAGETDVANASRAIKDDEAAACAKINRTPVEFRVGTDALAVVVSVENTFAQDLTMQQLADIFGGVAKTWADVDPSYPAEAIQLFSPGTDSGTFDYFVEAVFEKDDTKILGANPQMSEDDNVLAQGVAGSPYAIGYFGYAYYQENATTLRAVGIDGVAPSFDTAEDGTYPLARPLYIYSTADIMTEKPQVAAFINFYLTHVGDVLEDVGYFPAAGEAIDEAKNNWLAATGQ